MKYENKQNVRPPTGTGVISEPYPKMAFVSASTAATPEHYQHLKKAGIDTVSVCLHLSGHNHYKFATIHTKLAREAGMVTHAFFVTDLYNTFGDVLSFTKRFDHLQYSTQSKITIVVNSDRYVPNKEEEIIHIIDMIAKFHPRENIDVAFFKRDIDDGLYDLFKLPRMLNFTLINCDASEPGMNEVGTWVYTADFKDKIQMLAYDYFGYYTDESNYQLSLIDVDYVVQPGDTWLSIARRHGMPLNDLLLLNRATLKDKIYAGQVVRIA